jgi:hypothetical protein
LSAANTPTVDRLTGSDVVARILSMTTTLALQTWDVTQPHNMLKANDNRHLSLYATGQDEGNSAILVEAGLAQGA